MKTKKDIHILHSPVLANEVLSVLAPSRGETYLDLTAGYGGHARLVIKQTGNPSGSLLCDRDQFAVSYLSNHLPKGVQKLRATFADVCRTLIEEGRRFDMILADLGVSSPHLDNADRGFSISKDGPLDMRMDQSSGRTAAELINSASPAELEMILRVFGEEPRARNITKAIIAARPLHTTSELAAIIKKVYGTYTAHHPATKSFQAIRIAINDELGMLSEMLPLAVQLLKPKGRFAVITFHSLEDRIVKQFFKTEAAVGYDSSLIELTKKPITATATDIRSNPRARSAKLRAVAKK
jgi:16S rRNA (cytosine1402-N4)-methyltransferase